MSNNPLPLILGGTIGIVGVLAMSWNFGIGLIIFLVGLGIIGFAYMSSRRKQETRERVIPHEVPVEVPEQNQRRMQEFLGKPVIPDHKALSLLKRTLHQANLDPRAPVVVGDKNQTLLSMQEVLVEMITIADAHGLPVNELAGDLTKIYPRIFENVEMAIVQYPGDLELLTSWLANRSLRDVRTELDTQGENVRKSMAG